MVNPIKLKVKFFIKIEGDWGEHGEPDTGDIGENDRIWQTYEIWTETNPLDSDTDKDGL